MDVTVSINIALGDGETWDEERDGKRYRFVNLSYSGGPNVWCRAVTVYRNGTTTSNATQAWGIPLDAVPAHVQEAIAHAEPPRVGNSAAAD